MNNPATSISVIAPIQPAIDCVKRILFQPFVATKWFIIGFCAWLATLAEGGFGGGGNFNFGSPGRGGNWRREVDQARDFVLDNLYWIVPAVVAGLVILFAIGALLTWLSSRGRFMFLHCVALDVAEVGVPWHRYAREGNSLFWFRLIVGLIGTILILPLVVLVAVLIVRMIDRGQADLGGILTIAITVLVTIALAIVFGVIGKLTKDFVVPIMFLRQAQCVAAWRELLTLISSNVGHFIVYLLFQIVLAMAIGAMVFGVVLITCCLAGCLLAIPYLGTVLLLPLLVFGRSYSLLYLAQYGAKLDVFSIARTLRQA